MRGFFGRPRGRDGMRSTPSELEGCLGLKIGNFRCTFGCSVLFILALIGGGVIALLVWKYGVKLF